MLVGAARDWRAVFAHSSFRNQSKQILRGPPIGRSCYPGRVQRGLRTPPEERKRNFRRYNFIGPPRRASSTLSTSYNGSPAPKKRDSRRSLRKHALPARPSKSENGLSGVRCRAQTPSSPMHVPKTTARCNHLGSRETRYAASSAYPFPATPWQRPGPFVRSPYRHTVSVPRRHASRKASSP